MDYVEINRLNWDERAPAHAASPDYHVAEFARTRSFLSPVVRFDRPRLGDITGLRGVHLQCHIGTDTISLARLGAHMTGLDFSPAALAEARRIAALVGAEVDYVEAELYDAVRFSARSSSTSSTPGSARLAGSRTSAGGRRRSPTCFGRADACSSGRPTR